jgi:hypothetical protein
LCIKGGSTNALFTVVGAVCVVWCVGFLTLLVVCLVVLSITVGLWWSFLSTSLGIKITTGVSGEVYNALFTVVGAVCVVWLVGFLTCLLFNPDTRPVVDCLK